MVKQQLYRFSINDNGMYMPQREEMSAYLKSLPEGDYTLTIQKIRKARTHSQNRYYWMIMGLIADECGFDSAEEVHTAMRIKFLLDRTSKKLPFIASTTTLDTKEMSEYMDKVIRYAEDPIQGLGLSIPSPEEALILNYILQ